MSAWKYNSGIIFLTLFLGQISWGQAPIRILSLDGGGIKGIIQATILTEFERQLDKPVAQIFDLVAGSSTGGIIALGLTTPSPRYSAQEMLEVYMQHGSEVFHASLHHKIKTAAGLWGPKYKSSSIARFLNTYLGNTMLSQALIPTIITGYHVDGEVGVEFSSVKAQASPLDMDCLMRDVALATSAAPVLFDTPDVEYTWGTLRAVADGALYKGNPVLVAYINAKQLYPGRKIEVYSIGTGKIRAEKLTKDLRERGLLNWIFPIFEHVQNGDSEGDNAFLHRLLNEDGEENFFRININLDRKHKSISDISDSNLQYLYQKGLEATKSPIFKNMIARLKN